MQTKMADVRWWISLHRRKSSAVPFALIPLFSLAVALAAAQPPQQIPRQIGIYDLRPESERPQLIRAPLDSPTSTTTQAPPLLSAIEEERRRDEYEAEWRRRHQAEAELEQAERRRAEEELRRQQEAQPLQEQSSLSDDPLKKYYEDVRRYLQETQLSRPDLFDTDADVLRLREELNKYDERVRLTGGSDANGNVITDTSPFGDEAAPVYDPYEEQRRAYEEQQRREQQQQAESGSGPATAVGIVDMDPYAEQRRAYEEQRRREQQPAESGSGAAAAIGVVDVDPYAEQRRAYYEAEEARRRQGEEFGGAAQQQVVDPWEEERRRYYEDLERHRQAGGIIGIVVEGGADGGGGAGGAEDDERRRQYEEAARQRQYEPPQYQRDGRPFDAERDFYSCPSMCKCEAVEVLVPHKNGSVTSNWEKKATCFDWPYSYWDEWSRLDKDVDTLVIENPRSRLTDLPGVFDGFYQLRQLNVSNAGLKRIPSNTADQLRSLYALFLPFNEIEQVPELNLHHMPELIYLNLIYNRLHDHFDGAYLARAGNLIQLDLTGNEFGRIPKSLILFKGERLQWLSLMNNNIKRVSDEELDAFERMPMMRRLYLHQNPFCEEDDNVLTARMDTKKGVEFYCGGNFRSCPQCAGIENLQNATMFEEEDELLGMAGDKNATLGEDIDYFEPNITGGVNMTDVEDFDASMDNDTMSLGNETTSSTEETTTMGSTTTKAGKFAKAARKAANVVALARTKPPAKKSTTTTTTTTTTEASTTTEEESTTMESTTTESTTLESTTESTTVESTTMESTTFNVTEDMNMTTSTESITTSTESDLNTTLSYVSESTTLNLNETTTLDLNGTTIEVADNETSTTTEATPADERRRRRAALQLLEKVR